MRPSARSPFAHPVDVARPIPLALGATLLPFLAALIAAIALCPAAARAQGSAPFADYAAGSSFLPQTPSVTGGALGAFANPAAWATNDRAEFALWWNDRVFSRDGRSDWGVSYGRHVGFALDSRAFGGSGFAPFSPQAGGQAGRVVDWQFGVAGGDRRHFYGLAWRWSSGDGDRFGREHGFNLGFIERPTRWLSAGLSGLVSTRSGARLGIADIGVRPTGASWLTLFADYSLRDDQRLRQGRWGAGIELRPIHGLMLGLKYLKADAPAHSYLLFNAGVAFGGAAYHVMPTRDQRAHEVGATTFVLRARPPFRGSSIPGELGKGAGKRYVPIDLEGKQLGYRKFRLFDEKHVAWLDLNEQLDSIRDSKGVRGVAVNIAGLEGRPSLVWELREKLLELRGAGKEVIVHADRLSMLGAWLASAGDRITLDPSGGIDLPGVALRRTYLKNLLDKLGLGFQELRFLPYKSAVEILAREDMSEADREQYGRMADVLYETLRDGICARRPLTAAGFDSLVNDKVLLLPQEAKQAHLVDDLSRWSDLQPWLAKERDGSGLSGLKYDPHRRYYDERWGRPPTVAVVYAVGDCAMDTGIKGRATSAHLRRLARDPDVAAVVLRADSPGGDPLPSDLVADATLKLIKAGKPVVVSQGDVAASGGYWISMDGSRILTTPLTLTGSIGVIAGWLYDNGLGGKIGLRSDGVQRGDHADLFTGLRLPFIGVSLPARALDDAELVRVKQYILTMYEEFVAKVARARKLQVDSVREIAGGRVWMGGDAVARGLCDQPGGMADAIALAKELAGIRPGAEVILDEYPERPLLKLPSLLPPLPRAAAPLGWLARLAGMAGEPEDATGATASTAAVAAGQQGDYSFDYLRRVAGSPAAPLLLLPPEAMPRGWWIVP